MDTAVCSRVRTLARPTSATLALPSLASRMLAAPPQCCQERRLGHDMIYIFLGAACHVNDLRAHALRGCVEALRCPDGKTRRSDKHKKGTVLDKPVLRSR